MSIQTDLNVSPYFDDYKETNDYYKILFRPGVAVQTRELNQLQTMLQKQIERFGDNVFKRGAVIDGCDITYHKVFPYVKIKDLEGDGAPVNVAQYVGYHIRNQANVYPVTASITTVTSGFESQSPNLNTLYIKYLNSGYANVGGVLTEQQSFSANQTLTIYNPNSVIEKVLAYDTSSGFANTDAVVFLSALAIQNTTGGTSFANNFYVGDFVSDGTANVEVVGVDTNTSANVVILRVKPRPIDLKAANSELWTIYANTNIQSSNVSPSSVANVVAIIGSGAAGSLKTGTLGEIDSITITSKGSGYSVLPTVSIASPGATTGQIAEANVIAQNYLTTVIVANNSVSPVGTGYAVTIGDGVIYQKGYFSRVNEHLVIVEKYNNTPDKVSVGFDTSELIVNYNQDQSLLDNATGSPNETAPGANRLKLTPKLVTKTADEIKANTDFLAIVEFAEGNPYKQSRQTVYNIVGTEMARRTYEESGNYVLDEFILATKAPSANLTQTSFEREASSFGITIDPGLAYINGLRVETTMNYATTTDKGTDTYVVNNAIISMNYGNYIRVNEVGGTFLFKTGDIVELYADAKQYLSTSAGADINTADLGQRIGTARIRSITHESGTPGTPMAVYRLYLFDLRLATARNLTLVRSIYYGGSTKGICDVVLENGVAVMKDNNTSSLVYYGGNPAIKNANNLAYTYRTVNTYTLASNGIISFSAVGGESFPYTGTLSTTQEKDIIVVPLANVQMAANISGAISCNTSSTEVTGLGSFFAYELQAGDFLNIGGSVIGQIDSIANNNILYLTANASGAVVSGNAVIYLPQHVPVTLDKLGRSANVNNTANTMYVNIGGAVNTATPVAVTFNVRSSNTTPVTKTVNRDRYVRIAIANNSSGASGPWTLGIPDVFRLGKVYKGPNTTFLDTDTTDVVDVTQHFYVDHNQNEDYYGISYLYMNPKSQIAISNTDCLLVKFDHFTDAGEGLKGPGNSGSYLINDTLPLANSATTIHTMEIPEMYGAKGAYYDLRDHFDFRPQSANTVVANSNPANAPINPTEPSDEDRFTIVDKKFPAPDSFLTGTIEYYQGRVDRVTIDSAGRFHVIKGTPGTYEVPTAPVNALTINTLTIPPYPSLPTQLSAQTVQFIDTKIANEKYTSARSSKFRITTNIDKTLRASLQPRGYTMADIGKLEQRIKTLEYYSTLSLTESNVQKKIIPSSGNASVDRFKFGFFVDSFDSYAYSDRTNPGYNASVINGYLSPAVEEVNLPLTLPKRQVSLPYEEVEFITQKTATDGPVYVAPVYIPPAPIIEPDTGTWYQPPVYDEPVYEAPVYTQPTPIPEEIVPYYTDEQLREAAKAIYYAHTGGYPTTLYDRAITPFGGSPYSSEAINSGNFGTKATSTKIAGDAVGWDGTEQGAIALGEAYGFPKGSWGDGFTETFTPEVDVAPPIIPEEPAVGYTNQEQPQTYEPVYDYNNFDFGYIDYYDIFGFGNYYYNWWYR